MPAYFIAQIEVTAPETFKAYGARVPATIEKYGGRYVVRGGAITPLEETPPKYESEDYAPLSDMRRRASNGPLFIVEGA
jgi:uncharacterized protein (DUF1330 family)